MSGDIGERPELNGIVEGTENDDRIDLGYTGDPQGDRIDSGDAILSGAGPDDDVVLAFGGDDTVEAGRGNDEVHGGDGDDRLMGGPGSDSLYGGDGDDLLDGDGGAGTEPTVTVTFVNETAGYLNTVGIYEIDPVTGAISNVRIGFENASLPGSGGNLPAGATFSFTVTPGAQVGLFIVANGAALNFYGGLGEGELRFVDAFGNPAAISTVNPTLVHVGPGGAITPINGLTYHSAGHGANLGLNPDGQLHTQLYSAGPNSIEIGFEDLFWLGDADFDDPILAVSLSGNVTLNNAHVPVSGSDPGNEPANDLLVGGDGNDTAFGGAGNDTIIGGTGSNRLFGGDDRDTFLGMSDGDEVDGGSGGDDFDTLDLRGTGTVSVVYTSVDLEDGVAVNIDTGAILTFEEIENVLHDRPTGRDGIVSGTPGADLIDLNYTGDPDGDRIDAGDALLPGAAPDDDLVIAGDGDDTVLAGLGDDLVLAGKGDDYIDLGIGNDTGLGGDGNDYIDGRDGDDVMFGGRGDDTLVGGDGDDVAHGDDGDDFIATGSGDDTVYGGAGNDYIDGFTGDDSLEGGAGDDTVLGGQGNDTIRLGDGNDLASGNPGDDWIDGGAGDDTIEGNDGDDTLEGGAGNDVIAGGPGSNSMFGGDDRDTFFATGDDRVEGGEGGDDFDTLIVNGPAEVEYDPNDPEAGTVFFLDVDGNRTGVTISFVEIERVIIRDLSELDGVVEGTEDGDLIDESYTGDPEGDRIDNFDSLENITDYTVLTDPNPSTFVEILGGPVRGDNRDAVLGKGGNDTILAGLGDDVVYGGEGDDEIYGGIGADELVGDEGDDTIYGGVGVDRLFGGDGNDYLDGGEQTDVIFGGAGDDTIIGGEGNDILFGGEGANLIDGGLGGDTIQGGSGDDTIFGGLGDDSIRTGGGNNFVDAGLGTNIVIAEEGNDTLIGGAGDDLLQGGGGDDLLQGKEGDDTLEGGDGDDTLIGGAGRDSLVGGAGRDRITGGTPGVTGLDAIGQTPDTIEGGEGDDILDGSSGDDQIFGGDGDDLVGGGSGADTIDGGDGDDTIFASGEIDIFTGAVTDEEDSASLRAAVLAEGGGALIFGGRGNDLIHGTSNDDTIFGGIGDDTIHGKGGQDSLSGDQGEDVIYGGDGDDTIDGGIGEDLLYGGEGQDQIFGGIGEDTIFGDGGDDRIFGGGGDDELHGGQGQDSIEGGDGNDTIFGGFGVDSLFGGAGRDVFIITSLEEGNGDFIDGGSTGDDFDTLDMSGLISAGFGIRFENLTTDPDGNSQSGTAIILRPDGSEAGRITFTEIENLIPCFTPGTLIATPKGQRRVEELRPGDRVITRDNGIREIAWTGARTLTAAELARAPHMRPVLIRAGSLGQGLPERDLLVSPNHRMLIADERTSLWFDEHEVLVAAKHLAGGRGIQRLDVPEVTYIHFLFEAHEVVLANGAWTESFQPGHQTLDGMGAESRDEILALFPELAAPEGIAMFAAARKTLKRHEALLLAR